MRSLLTSFVGRKRELQRLHDLVESGRRLITVLGPPGSGKTRLAHEALQRLRDSGMPVATVDLRDVEDAPSMCRAISGELSLPASASAGEPHRHLGDALASFGTLLVLLDNFEQLVDPCAAIVEAWLGQSELRILLTSRRRTRISGEHVLELAPLATHGEAGRPGPAVRLFEDRARAVRGDYAVSDHDRETIERICTELDGLPLAIELAAARMRVLSAPEILGRFGRSERGVRDSLGDAIRGSWDLLSAPAQDALAQCSVFAGPFDVEALEAVVDLADGVPPIDVIEELADQSLVQVRHDAHRTRFELLLSIREFATGRVRDPGGVRSRHAQHYARTAERWWRSWHTHAGAEIRTRVAESLDNLRGAFARSIGASEPAETLALACLLAAFFTERGPASLGVEVLQRALADRPTDLSERERELRTEAHTALAQLLLGAGRIGAGVEHARRAVALSEGTATPAEGRALYQLAYALHRQGGVDDSLELLERACAHGEAIGNDFVLGEALVGKSSLLSAANRHDPDGIARFRRGVDLLRRSGAGRAEAFALIFLGSVYLDRGRLDSARTCFDDATAIGDRLGDRHIHARAAGYRGMIAACDGEFAKARAIFEDSIRLHRAAGGGRVLIHNLAMLALVLCRIGDFAQARSKVEQGLDLLGDAGDRRDRALLFTARAVQQISTGDLSGAELSLGHADGELAALAEELRWPASVEVDLARGLLEVSRARERPEAAGLCLQAAQRRLESALDASNGKAAVYTSSYVRLLASSLAEHLRAQPRPRVLTVGPDGLWFERSSDGRVSLKRRGAMRRILASLVAARKADPANALSADQLVECGWPGERIRPEAAMNRLYATMARLRQLGLADCICTVEDGYQLDPELELVEAEPL